MCVLVSIIHSSILAILYNNREHLRKLAVHINLVASTHTHSTVSISNIDGDHNYEKYHPANNGCQIETKSNTTLGTS